MESIWRDFTIPTGQELAADSASPLAPLSHGQRSLWFLHHLAPDGGAYNIAAAARVRPLVIQSLFMRVNGDPPSSAELEAFCDRLNEITTAGGQLKLVQIYTVARRPAASFVSPLTDAEVDALKAAGRFGDD